MTEPIPCEMTFKGGRFSCNACYLNRRAHDGDYEEKGKKGKKSKKAKVQKTQVQGIAKLPPELLMKVKLLPSMFHAYMAADR